jgi:Tfp pilus assembly protein PilV
MLWAGSHSQANIRHQRGVTLIEILVAMTILFATVTTGMVAWQNSLNSSEKAANLLQLLAKTDYCRDHVLAVLRENSAAQQSGRGEFDAVHFSWQANQLAFQPPPPRFEPESGIPAL